MVAAPKTFGSKVLDPAKSGPNGGLNKCAKFSIPHVESKSKIRAQPQNDRQTSLQGPKKRFEPSLSVLWNDFGLEKLDCAGNFQNLGRNEKVLQKAPGPASDDPVLIESAKAGYSLKNPLKPEFGQRVSSS